VAVKDQRILIYLLTDVGVDGNVDQQYVLVPSTASDQGYWASVSYIGGREKTVGAQAEHVVVYDVTTWDSAPLFNSQDLRVTVLPDESPVLQVRSVAKLYVTGEKQSKCEEVSDANDTLTV
jgi:hypothetical protein